MAEKILKSPGVSAREIDLSQPGSTRVQGTPAVVIGTSQKGPAFVPITFATYNDFVAKFGASDGEKFGPIAVAEWMRNARSGAYVRTLGIGKGEKAASSGKVENAGFVVGARQVQGAGTVGHNSYAGTGGPVGRTYFMSCLMSESNGSSYFRDSGFDTPMSASILRAVMMFPSGVIPGLSASSANTDTNPTTASVVAYSQYAPKYNAGETFGMMDLSANGGSTFAMYLNGYTGTGAKVISASMDPGASNYFSKVLNTDASQIENKGHLLYAHFDVDSALAVPSPQNGVGDGAGGSHRARVFITTGSGARNTFTGGSDYKPNYEGFEYRFTHAKSPYIISQVLGSTEKNLFRFHALDAGSYGNNKVKISIANIQKSRDVNNKYGTFDVLVRKFDDYDSNPIILEKFIGCDLNPNSARFISRIIGDSNVFYDFEKAVANQKLVAEGSYANQSQYIRVQVSDTVANGTMNAEALPVGFRGPFHLVTSGSTMLSITGSNATYLVDTTGAGSQALEQKYQQMQQAPILYRKSIASGTGNKKRVVSDLYWGVQNTKVKSTTTPNDGTAINSNMENWTKYYPGYEASWPAWVGDNEGTADKNGTILDADRFLNGKFSLERVLIKTKSASDVVDPNEWQNASYIRTGVNPGTSGYRFLNVEKDFGQQASRRYYKFTTIMQGGFDGLNIFDEDKHKLLNAAAIREISDSSAQGGTSGPTVTAYRKALDVIAEKSNLDIQLLAIPGIRAPSVTDYAIDKTEERFDALYIMDIEECDYQGTSGAAIVTGSLQQISVTNTAAKLEGRSLDTSFAAAYFPDVLVVDPVSGANVRCPPSVAVLGAMALNDSVAHPWFAPAGFSRGALPTTEQAQIKLNRANLDTLYEVDINPITSFPTSRGVVVFGQKTLQQAQSALDRVNVRRLLIDIRRKVRNVANGILFEPNREATLARFSGAVQPILTRIQAQQGLDRFKVVIDTTTTTQLDVENNTVRGKIFLQPTRSVEFISLDFVVTNAGAEI